MSNRVHNVGFPNSVPFINTSESSMLRKEIDKIIDQQVELWYQTVPYAAHLEGEVVDPDYYRRHLIETA